MSKNKVLYAQVTSSSLAGSLEGANWNFFYQYFLILYFKYPKSFTVQQS